MQNNGGYASDTEAIVKAACKFPFVSRSLQLLYGARMLLVTSRTQAPVVASSRGLFNASPADMNPNMWGHVVGDDFMEMATLLLNSDVTTSTKLLFPHIVPLKAAMLCDPGDLGENGVVTAPEEKPIEWFTSMQKQITLRRESLLIDGSPAYLLDAGTYMILYRNIQNSKPVTCSGVLYKGTPEDWASAAAVTNIASSGEGKSSDEAAGSGAGAGSSSVEEKEQLTNINLDSPPTKVNSRSRSWNILGHLDRMAGRLAGEESEEVDPTSPVPTHVSPPVVKSPNQRQQNPSLSSRVGEKKGKAYLGEDDNGDDENLDKFAQGLYHLASWLPSTAQKRLEVNPIVPRVISAEQGTASSSILTRFLLLDVPDAPAAGSIKNMEDVCLLSFDTFLARAMLEAEYEVPELARRAGVPFDQNS